MSPRSGEATRTRILDAAHKLIVENGYAATSLDSVIAAAKITKGAFFYHFASKPELATAVMERFIATLRGLTMQWLESAEARTDDPYTQLLYFLDDLEVQINETIRMFNGCLVASFAYEAEHPGTNVLKLSRDYFLECRVLLGKKAREAARAHGVEVDDAALADMIAVVYEGVFVLVRVIEDRDIARRQFALLRNYLALLFADGVRLPASGAPGVQRPKRKR